MIKNVKFLRSGIYRLQQLDPNYSAAVSAFKAAIPGVLGALLWVYFRRPFTSMIIILSLLGYIVSFAGDSYKHKYLRVGFFLFLLAVIQFAIAVLWEHFLVFYLYVFLCMAIITGLTSFFFSGVLEYMHFKIYRKYK